MTMRPKVVSRTAASASASGLTPFVTFASVSASKSFDPVSAPPHDKAKSDSAQHPASRRARLRTFALHHLFPATRLFTDRFPPSEVVRASSRTCEYSLGLKKLA